MINQLPIIYMMNQDGTEQQIDASKFRFEFGTGENITVHLDNLNPNKKPEIVIRGYCGNKEYGYDVNQKSVILNIRPMACNLVGIAPEVL